jgi:NADH-quinone oxidoreductase subunit G
MIEIELDGKKIEVSPGSMLMHAAEKAGVYIPHFCYHKKLSIAANCRMCLVEVEKAPKPMPACATPVTQGMIVRSKSEKAIKAQQSVMEFLLVNHPLDCPICDQGGECQLQDLAIGYGGSTSRYKEEKRVVSSKNVGALISMEEMSRCIHCTRCIRFGQEIAGEMELGMSHRGEHSEIETFLDATIDSELSGNMIDICPVGALTSKPFRYQARTWELSRRKTVSPHDSTGTNLIAQTKNHRVVRVVPLENEVINECWIADRDRFSYEALNSEDRLTEPMLKQGGHWKVVSWGQALEYVANGINQIRQSYGSQSVGLLASPHSTVEELHMAGMLIRGIGSQNIDHRLRSQSFFKTKGIRWLGRSIASLSDLDRVWVIGSDLRKDHPLFAQRIRQSVRKGAKIAALVERTSDWAMPLTVSYSCESTKWGEVLTSVAAAVAVRLGIASPFNKAETDDIDDTNAVAELLLSGQKKAIFLGNAAAHHPDAVGLLSVAHWIADQTGASIGYLTEAANTVGAQMVRAEPLNEGFNTQQMLDSGLKAFILLHVEPEFDVCGGLEAAKSVGRAEMVVTMSSFKANMDISDVLLPVAPFAETAGSFINAEGRLQSFHAVVKPLGETRPAWKVFRVLGNMLECKGFSAESASDVLAEAVPGLSSGSVLSVADLNNRLLSDCLPKSVVTQPCTASIYQLDGLVRRSPALQATRDAKNHALLNTLVGSDKA